MMYGDWLIRMPEKVTFQIINSLELTDIISLSQCCMFLKKLCSKDDLWRDIYAKHSTRRVTEDVRELARDIGWKKTFFTNKLQLQKEVSRLRKSADLKRREKEARTARS